MIPQSARTASPKPQKGTRARERRRAARGKGTTRAAAYALVDFREGGRCRFTRVTGWLEHHHIVKRSQGGTDTTGNLVLVTKQIHDDVHGGLLVLTGNADGVLTLRHLVTGERLTSPVPEVAD